MRKQKKSTILILTIGLLVFFILFYLGLTKVLEGGFFKLFSPVERLLYNWGLVIKKVNQLGEILAENQYLKEELAKLSIDYVKLLNLEAENNYLRSELNYLEKNQFNYQLAEVVGKQLYNEKILIINKGSNAGLKENLAATVGQGIIVGKIIAVTADRAEVQLLTDPNSALAVSLTHESGTNGIIKGKAGSGLAMELIPQNIVVNEDDLVVTSGLEETIPRGLLVGKVSGVENLVGQIFQKANVAPLFDYQNLQTLTIIITYK